MSRLDFHLEFQSELPQADELRRKADERLQTLVDDRSDVIGASVVVRELSNDETLHTFQARVVAYARPENVAGVEQADTPQVALREALEAVERQIRQRREKFRKPWEQPEKIHQVDVYELTPQEIYSTYANRLSSLNLADLSRNRLAATLMLDEHLDEETAYFAADQILAYADQLET